MSKNFIKQATSNSHGQFKAKAQKAGMSTAAFANKEAGAPGKLGKQANLAKTLMGMNGGGGKSPAKAPQVKAKGGSNPFANAAKAPGSQGGF